MADTNECNKKDGVVASWPDNVDQGVVSSDADDMGYQKDVSIGAVKAGKQSNYKGPGNTALGIGDPRFA